MEVVIAIAIVSSALAGSFALSQKNVSNLNNSQEHNKAMTILEAQVEMVRSIAGSAADTSSGVFSNSPPYFCMDQSGGTPVRYDLPKIASTIPDINADDFSVNYEGPCSNANGIYNLATTYDDSENVFRFYVRWEASDGDRNQVTYLYRANPHIVTVPYPATPPVCSSTNQIAMVLDRSDSMQDNNIAPGVTRLEKLIDVSKYFVNHAHIGAGNQAGIISFSDNSDVNVLTGMTTSIPTLENRINNIGHHHGTYYLPPLNRTDSLWDASGLTKVVVFITDGVNNSESTSAILAKTSAMKASGIVIYTIGIGTDNFTNLKKMATDASHFVNAKNSAQLDGAIDSISAEVSCT